MADTQVGSRLNLHHEKQGKGRPLLLLHGFAASLYSWKHLAPDLARHYRVISVDLKGFGASPKPLDEAYSMDDQANLVIDFIKRHDLREMTLIGHSFGGGVALLTALKLPEEGLDRLSSLVLIGSVGFRQPLHIFLKALRIPVLRKGILKLAPVERQVSSILKLAYFDDAKISEEAIAAYAAPLKTHAARHALRETALRIIPPDLKTVSSTYKSIQVPTLIIWGRHDEIVPLRIGKRLRAAIPNSQLVIIESSGHIPQEEVPEETSRAIIQFLTTVDAKS